MEYNKFVNDVANRVIYCLDRRDRLEKKDELLPAKDAAALLHISVKHLYRTKNRYAYVKSGDNGQLRFYKSSLVANYAQ